MGAQYQVIDNYFSSYLFNSFRDAVFSDSFPWYFNDIRETNQYTHAFLHYNKEGYSSNSPNSAYMDYIYKMGYKLNVDRFFRIKLNANPSTLFHNREPYHVDVAEKCKTAILYINTNNGYTQFKKGGKVKSVENRVLIFDSTLEHALVTSTNVKRRVVLNLNYSENNG